ncbi:MAG: indole-3-glycerol phosphate synthase TrpC, partial [Desulfamplus sp.]|nr:indole-3-glycerol phosphate synthase TrpC [Desulfamplus sp.]
MGISGFLKEVVELKRMDVDESKRLFPQNQIRQEAEERLKKKSPEYREPLLFLRAIEKNSPGHAGIIAEIKKASPSKGDIRIDLDPAKYAKDYTKAGACAISVLTERHYFKGSLDDLKAARSVTSIPILRKDFTLSSYQIYEAKAAGADSILLITSMLSKEQLRDYVNLAREIGMEPLVEIHSEWELDKALFANAGIIGINNRNLETLETDLNVAKRVVPFFTANQIAVEASGISSVEDIQKGLDCGIFSFLVGESIVRAENTEEFIQSLVRTTGSSESEKTKGVSQSEKTNSTLESFNTTDFYKLGKITSSSKSKNTAMIKICGLTSFEDASACVKAGADAVGFIFYPKSPRYISPEQAAKITKKLPDHVMITGVFVDEDYKAIMKVVNTCSLKAVQLHGNESP